MGRIHWLALLFMTSCAASVSSSRHGLFDYSGSAPMRWEEPGSCQAMTKADRLRILKLADPQNFPRTRYHRGPRYGVDRETDCSHFVHEIYRRAGFSYPFKTTRGLPNAPQFEMLPESEAMPGDLMLFRGHVGIVDRNGKIISATRSRGRRSSITRLNKSAFRPIHGAWPVLRFRCREPMRRLAQEPR